MASFLAHRESFLQSDRSVCLRKFLKDGEEESLECAGEVCEAVTTVEQHPALDKWDCGLHGV
ncbi:hypothetical protein KOR42_49010 [Thalassoglobus neptunius]|uniref:Uncharacterized protein n=1 Tax=Thalassoglobus neptunius TaxID=1938619 RepID=A0A5C5VPY0_9PLAN|nr:hypothetical protein KOR42_49010 [Thalassoglobus neptunius]